MKRKFNLFLIILSLGVLLLPSQNLMAQDKTMDCCETQSAGSDACHHTQEDQPSSCHLPADSDQDCETQCANSCSLCLHAGISLLRTSSDALQLPVGPYINLKEYVYLQPLFSSTSQEIWQPPKIG